jgi:pantoate--beta-alanine ligase
MWVARTIADARKHRASLRGRVAFVPTMGALHSGHVSLIDAGRALADHVIVSIFVNPTQFGPNEDYLKYPRPVDADLAACEKAGAAGVFMPSVEEMYPPGRLACEVSVPALASVLEGEFRPGHFAGVCRVVAKLFHIVQPEVACFGMKDYQQLKVIQAMVADQDMPLWIAEVPTKREPDGLAMSSRNVYLDAEARRHAAGIYKALQEARMLVEEAGEVDPTAVESAMRHVLEAHHVSPDYATVRHPTTLSPLDALAPAQTNGVVALIAGRLGGVRLIDNLVLGRTSNR